MAIEAIASNGARGGKLALKLTGANLSGVLGGPRSPDEARHALDLGPARAARSADLDDWRVQHHQVDGPVDLRPGERPFAAGPHHSAHVVFAEIEDLLAAPSPASP